MSFDECMVESMVGYRWDEVRETERITDFYYDNERAPGYFGFIEEGGYTRLAYVSHGDGYSDEIDNIMRRLPDISALDTMFKLSGWNFDEFVDSLVEVLVKDEDEAKHFCVDFASGDECYRITYETDFRSKKNKDKTLHVALQIIDESGYCPGVFFDERLVPNRLRDALYEIPSSDMDDWQKLMCIEGIMSAWGYENTSECTL